MLYIVITFTLSSVNKLIIFQMSKKYLKLKVRAEEQKSEPEFHETKETHEEVALNLSKEGGEKNGHIER